MSFNSINKAFENRFNVSKNILNEELQNKEVKANAKSKLLESVDKILSERHWKFTIPGNYRNAIFDAADEEDFDGVRFALMDICQYVVDHIEESEEFDEESIEDIKDEYSDLLEELDYQDFEDEDECNYWLNELYDLMDNTDIFLGLRESLNSLTEAYIISTWGQTEENPKQVAKDYNLSIEVLGRHLDETTYKFSGKKEDLERAKRDGYFYSDEEEIVDECLKESLWTDLVKKVPELVENINEDTEKTPEGKWVNKGKEGTHGEFKTKKEADAQRKAMFANGYKESLEESLNQNDLNNAVYHALADVCFEFNKKGNHPTEEEIDLAYDWFATHFWDSDDYMECLTEDTDVSKITIPKPYNKYFKISDEDPSLEGYEVGEELPEYHCRFLALLEPKKEEVEDIYPILTDDPDYPVVEDIMGRLTPVELPFDECLTEEKTFGKNSIKVQLAKPENMKKLNDISKISDLKTAKNKFIELIQSLDCTDQNKKQAIFKINNINNINGLYGTISTYLLGSKVI